MAVIKGRIRIDQKTKNLLKRIRPDEIAVINHEGLDEISAKGLVEAKVKAVINAAPSHSKEYPNVGPLILAKSGICLIDEVGNQIMNQLREGHLVEIQDNLIFNDGLLVGSGKKLSIEDIQSNMALAQKNLGLVLEKFVHNTIEYANQEQGTFLATDIQVPETKTRFHNRTALIVVRGHNYKEDLFTIRSFITEMKPVLIGVDGGADALLEFGYKPNLIIGDMDSVTDTALRCGAEIIVHGYSDGRAPGFKRINQLGLQAQVFAFPGTSEDIAMLVAYHKNCDFIVAVGTHTNLTDFLEKGRSGMSSTFLVRLKVGEKLVDAKGVGKLYRKQLHFHHVAGIVMAAIITLGIISYSFPLGNQLIKVFLLKLRYSVGI